MRTAGKRKQDQGRKDTIGITLHGCSTNSIIYRPQTESEARNK